MSYGLAFAALLALQLMGCADFARWVRQYTYPSEFRYIERDEVRSTMRQLAFHSRELNQLIQSGDGPQKQRSEIIKHLRAMEEAAEKLDQSGWPNNRRSYIADGVLTPPLTKGNAIAPFGNPI